jgi:hypothetical protein
MLKLALTFLLVSTGLAAQTCAVISPTSGQLFQAAVPIQLMATVSSAPTAYKLVWSVDYQRWATGFARRDPGLVNDYRDAWQGPWTVNWYTGLNGDGPHTVSGVVYDIFGNTLATCAVNFTVRIEGMSNQSVNALPNLSGNTVSGTGALGFLTFDGQNGQQTGSSVAIDGMPLPYDNFCGGAGATSQTGGWQIPSFNTACWPNGTHLLFTGYYIGRITDPYVLGKTFTSSNVSGNNVTVSNHYSVQGSVVTFSTTGTLPAPLVAGTQCYWANAACTATLSISGGVMTFTTNIATGATAGTPVYIRNIQSTNQTTGLPNCDGYYSAASGSGNSFTVAAPAGCPNGAASNLNLEVDINPYFANYIDANTISVSASPGGPTVTLSSGGSGAHTVTQRIRSPYWTGDPNNGAYSASDYASSGGPAYVQQLITFSNGTTPMELRPPYWEMHMVAGGSTQSVCPKIENTDRTQTTPSCNASGLSYTEVNDGGLSGVCSVDSSGNVSPLAAGWCQVQIACSACAAGGVSLRTVTVYIQVHSGSITFPHFTHNGTIANAFSPGNSFFPLSAWQLTIYLATPYNNQAASRPLWLGPVMQEANVNSSIITADPSGTAFGDPQLTTCYSATWPSQVHAYEAAFASQYGTYFEVDLSSTHSYQGFLSALLNNTTYNRQSCFAGFLSQLVSEGRTWKSVGVDELNNYMAGNYPFRNPYLGSTDFPSIVVSGGIATYNVGETFQGVWNQATGNGSWVKVAGAVTNTCLNGWFPVTNITNNGSGYPVSFTTPTTCANGTYTESTAQLYHYWFSTIVGGENAAVLPRLYGVNDNTNQNWDTVYFTQVVVSGGVAEFYAQAHGLTNGQAIRVHGSGFNLNTVKPVTVLDANHFTITYNSAFETVPANGTYTYSGGSGTVDANLYFSVDGNFPGGTPFLSLRNLFTSVSGHPATTWGAIGFTYNVGNPGVRNWEGSTTGADATFNYVPQPPGAIYGPDASVWQWANYSQSSSGLATRGYQLQPRSMLWGGGYVGGGNIVQYCRSYQFNPACDRPAQLFWRPEGTVAQMIAMLTLNVSALRLYNFAQNMTILFSNTCCGWQTQGTGTGAGMNPGNDPKQWAAMAYTDALIKLREDTELQPPANKPYLGPMFLTDAHTSAAYGNELKILCASEMPYGSQTVALPQISGGSMLKYILTGYSLSVKLLSGNPATDTDEFCSSPGRTTTYVAQPPGVNALNNVTFAPPAPLPFGASKFLLQVGYYPRAMQDDPITDCTSGCTVAIDHHNAAAWYRVIYADSNNLPRSIGDPVKIPSQGLN